MHPRRRRSRSSARPDESRFGDDGLGIFEVLMAISVFLICFVPILKMIPLGSSVIVYSNDQRLATSVLNTTLGNAQTTTVPDTDYTTPRTWTSAIETQTTQGGVNFRVYTSSGWCASDTAPGNGKLLTSGQASYHVVVKVEWGPNATVYATNHVVVDSTELGTLTNAPPDGTNVTSCPLGLS